MKSAQNNLPEPQEDVGDMILRLEDELDRLREVRKLLVKSMHFTRRMSRQLAKYDSPRDRRRERL